MPHERTVEEITKVRLELLELLDALIARKASEEEIAALRDTVDDLTGMLWKMTSEPANDG